MDIAMMGLDQQAKFRMRQMTLVQILRFWDQAWAEDCQYLIDLVIKNTFRIEVSRRTLNN